MVSRFSGYIICIFLLKNRLKVAFCFNVKFSLLNYYVPSHMMALSTTVTMTTMEMISGNRHWQRRFARMVVRVKLKTTANPHGIREYYVCCIPPPLSLWPLLAIMTWINQANLHSGTFVRSYLVVYSGQEYPCERFPLHSKVVLVVLAVWTLHLCF